MSLTLDEFGRTPIHCAAQEGHTEIVKALIKCSYPYPNLDPNAHDINGVTALHMAAQDGHIEIVRALIECSYNPNASDNKGVSTIYMAAQGGHTEIVKALIKASMELAEYPNAPNKIGSTPIHVAAQNGHAEVVKALIACTRYDITQEDTNNNFWSQSKYLIFFIKKISTTFGFWFTFEIVNFEQKIP